MIIIVVIIIIIIINHYFYLKLFLFSNKNITRVQHIRKTYFYKLN